MLYADWALLGRDSAIIFAPRNSSSGGAPKGLAGDLQGTVEILREYPSG
jgi:hypothetical protein